MKKLLIARFIAELLVIAVVTLIFKLIADRLTAGIVAGAVFIAIGFYVIAPGRKSVAFRKTAVFWAGCAHLLLSAFPLFLTRLLNAGLAFQDVRVLGLPGPVFHRISTTIYMIMLMATIFDFICLIIRERRDQIRG